MQLLMEKPACRGRAIPVVLSSILNEPEFIKSLPPVQRNPAAERKFALGLAARVFGYPSRTNKPPRVEVIAHRQLRHLTQLWLVEQSADIQKSKDHPYAGVTIFEGKKYAHREWAHSVGLKLKQGPVSRRLGGEYAYGVFLPEQEARRAAYREKEKTKGGSARNAPALQIHSPNNLEHS